MATLMVSQEYTAMFLSSDGSLDYVGQSSELRFARGDSRRCHIVDIIDDDLCELHEPKEFFAMLAYVSGIQSITVIRDTTQVRIDDSNEPECSEFALDNTQ